MVSQESMDLFEITVPPLFVKEIFSKLCVIVAILYHFALVMFYYKVALLAKSNVIMIFVIAFPIFDF